jgi:DNA-binding FadR family transcriptional regulator
MEAAGEKTEESVDHDLRFHLSILEATGNPFLVSMGHVIESAIAFNIKLSVKLPEPARPVGAACTASCWSGSRRATRAAPRQAMVKLLQEAQGGHRTNSGQPRGRAAARAASTRRLRKAHR